MRSAWPLDISFVLVTSLWIAACAPGADELPYTLKQVGPNAWAAIDNPKAKSPTFANAGFVIGGDSVIVVDTFSNADAARQLLADIRTRTRLPVRFVVNTHYHEDHVAGNAVFADVGATILGHRNLRAWIHSENLRLLGPQIAPELKARIEGLIAPTVVYDDELDLHLGSRAVRIQSLPGHSGSDSIVIVPDARVVFMGDLLFRDMFPTLIDASVKVWIETLDRVTTGSTADYAFVPGHGDVGSASHVAAFRDYLNTLRVLVTDARAQGQSGDALVAAVTAALRPRYGRWDYFEPIAKDNVLQVDAEVAGTKRVPRE
jgi:glyoxylase-like metal-dependent hydrolase (beta-lactamase superfamily II)